MVSTLKPTDAAQTEEAVRWALSSETPVEILAGGSKRGLGRVFQADHTLDVSGLAGVNFHEPAELILSAGPATPLAEIEALLKDTGQMLAFEPMDYGPLLGGEADCGSIGGVFACNLSGPRRLKAGAARDHLLGFNAISGRGDAFKSGGRVVKNVTGYDLSKLITGSHGTLAVMTELTFKVLPAPEKIRTVLIFGLVEATATNAMSAAMNSAHEVSSAAHVPAECAALSTVGYVSGARTSVTAVRIEGIAPSVEDRCQALREILGDFGQLEELHGHNSSRFWREVRDVAYLAEPQDPLIWRISTAPATGHALVALLRRGGDVRVLYDWAGGLIWLAMPVEDATGPARLRAAVDAAGGHATLVRAPADLRASIPVFQPQATPLAALSARVKDSFDPKRLLNPGRMYTGV
jgi:glycolate oxidase FAD binding subunit